MITLPPPAKGKYHGVRELGSGSYGKIYQVTRKSDGRTLALRVVNGDPAAGDQSQQKEKRLIAIEEGERLKGLSHPYIIAGLEVLQEKRGLCVCIVMDWASKGSLRGRIKDQRDQGRSFKHGEILTWTARICSALVYLHDRKFPVWHLDIKPANILLKVSWHGVYDDVCLCDLGSGTTAGKQANPTRGSSDSLQYMAPEQRRSGTPEYSSACDMWSLGIVVLELCTLQRPGAPDSFMYVENGQLQLPHDHWPENLLPLRDDFLPLLLNTDPSQRATAAKALSDLQPRLERLPTESRELPTIRPASLEKERAIAKGNFCTLTQTKIHGEQVVAVKKVTLGIESTLRATTDLERELRIMSRKDQRSELDSSMNHPNVLKVVAQVRSGNTLFICFELLESVLRDVLPRPETSRLKWWLRRKTWTLERAVETAMSLASALAYCHGFSPDLRIIHRDVKPGNIGFRADNSVVLFDFGLSYEWSFQQQHTPAARNTERRALQGGVGCPRYMAPEVALSQPYNHKADVFSFAIVLWEMLSHERPFNDMDEQGYMNRVCHHGERLKLKEHWPQPLRELISECWHPDPDRRPECRYVEQQLRGANADPT